MTLLIDDHLLLATLCERAPAALDRLRRGRRVFTTGLWYHRLCRALASGSVTGTFSSRLGELPADSARRVIAAAVELPRSIGLVSFRDLGWPMADLLQSQRLNLVTLEATAAARHLQATIAVGEPDDGPLLRSAAQALDISVRVIPL